MAIIFEGKSQDFGKRFRLCSEPNHSTSFFSVIFVSQYDMFKFMEFINFSNIALSSVLITQFINWRPEMDLNVPIQTSFSDVHSTTYISG